MSASSPNGPHFDGLTYDEVRWWAVDLGTFTASILADAMGVDIRTAARAVHGLIFDGICEDTGEVCDGPHGYERIVDYVEPPDAPAAHPIGPDPVARAIAEAGRIAVPRGTPVRRSAAEAKGARRKMSTPGQAQKMKNRERNFERIQDAKAAAAKLQKLKQARVAENEQRKITKKASVGRRNAAKGTKK